jgi:hypothetical protein
VEKGSGSSDIHLLLHTLKARHAQQLTATVPGRYWCSFLIPPANGADTLAAFVANCFTEALLPVNLFCCLLHFSHNEGSVILIMGTEMM